MNIVNVKDYQEMSIATARMIYEEMQKETFRVLGLATGSTPLGVYKELIHYVETKRLSFASIHTVNLDEYIGLPKDHPNSYHQYMYDTFFKHIDIPIEQTHLPHGDPENLQEECQRYERLIEKLGGIDLQILGIGENGHIGFNEPGTSFHSKTHIVELATSTREANARFFKDESEVPKQAITMGIETILASKKIVLLASGEKKAEAVRQLIEGEVTELCPATVLQGHPNLIIVADEPALSLVNVELCNG